MKDNEREKHTTLTNYTETKMEGYEDNLKIKNYINKRLQEKIKE